jgi:hypothetical protein
VIPGFPIKRRRAKHSPPVKTRLGVRRYSISIGTGTNTFVLRKEHRELAVEQWYVANRKCEREDAGGTTKTQKRETTLGRLDAEAQNASTISNSNQTIKHDIRYKSDIHIFTREREREREENERWGWGESL